MTFFSIHQVITFFTTVVILTELPLQPQELTHYVLWLRACINLSIMLKEKGRGVPIRTQIRWREHTRRTT